MPEKIGSFNSPQEEMNPYQDPDAEETAPTNEQDYSITQSENPYQADGDENQIGTTELTPELAEQIGEQEGVLQETLGELNGNIEAIDNDSSPEERRDKWEKIKASFNSLKVKLNVAMGASLVAGMGAVAAGMAIYEQSQGLSEQLATNVTSVGIAGSLGTLAVLSLGHVYNKMRRNSQERSLYSSN